MLDVVKNVLVVVVASLEKFWISKYYISQRFLCPTWFGWKAPWQPDGVVGGLVVVVVVVIVVVVVVVIVVVVDVVVVVVVVVAVVVVVVVVVERPPRW